MKNHFVTFFSPGTFFAESTSLPIESWDVEEARRMASSIKERYNAVPYAFYFTTRGRGPDDLDSTVLETSGQYFINCKRETLEEIIERNLPDEETLRWNMRANGYVAVATTISGWKWTQPLVDGDVILPL